MSQSMTTQTTQRKSPCGCGGGDGCWETAKAHEYCHECEAHTVVRPRFFAGQLLTEDDLEALVSYVVTKTRIHNRYLHGDGVVCGLEVTCHPCGGGKVQVHPGYALDCCGNDILVPCLTELDINDMVHRLRVEKLGGHDCGDPCDEALDVTVDSGNMNNSGNGETAARRYCLYLRYCEERTDPVTPYTTEDECGPRQCEETRVREGYRFELRCPEDEGEPDNVFKRVRDCLSDLVGAEKSINDAAMYLPMAMAAKSVHHVLENPASLTFGDEHVTMLKTGTEELQQFLDDTSDVTEPKFKQMLGVLIRTGAMVYRFHLLDATIREALPGLEAIAEKSVDAARIVFYAAGKLLGNRKVVTVERYKEFAVAASEETIIRMQTALESDAVPRDAEAFMYAFGVPYSASLQMLTGEDLAGMKNWLLSRLDAGTRTDCKLLADVQAIQVSARMNTEILADTGVPLVVALLRYLADCICSALNPPCQPCEDPAVLLACMEVEECEVIDICNMERTFVLSAPAMRYWVPFLHSLGQELERTCCALRKQIAPAASVPEVGEITSYVVLVDPDTSTDIPLEAEPGIFQALADFSELPPSITLSLANVTNSLERMTLGTRDIPVRRSFMEKLRTAVGPFVPEPKASTAREELVKAIEDPEVGRAVEKVVRAGVREAAHAGTEEAKTAAAEAKADAAEAHARLEVFGQKVEAVEALENRVVKVEGLETKLTRVNRLVDNRLTATSLKETGAYKDLKKKNDEMEEVLRTLEKSNRELVDRVKKLEEEG